MTKLLDDLLREEEQYQFERFNEDTAWKLGSWMVENAIQKELPIAIDIRHGEHQVFHVSRPGTCADNDAWIKRKLRLVNRTGHSSYYTGQFLKSIGKSIEEKYLVSESDYAPHGGCVPIKVRGTGLVGTLTVSGMTGEEDHQLAMQAIKHFLEEDK